MMDRSKLESRLEQNKHLKQIKQLADQVRRMSPLLLEEVRSVLRRPRVLGAAIEDKSPWLNRRFLGVASNLAEPFMAGMGLKVERLSEDVVEVSMPGWWRNQGENGSIHSGALTTLGEFTSRLFWEHHLDLRHSEANVEWIQLRILSRPTGDMTGVYRLPVSERESVMHRLRADGVAEMISETAIYESGGRLVAEVEVQWKLTRHLAISAGTVSES